MSASLKGLLLALFGLLVACSPDAGRGPAPVTWDRDACEHCRMALSDHHYATEVRLTPGGQAHKFDDLGCALTWLGEQPGGVAGAAEIWVADHRDGHWLEARTAHYVTGKTTPMDYGLGAVAEALPGSLDFTGAQQAVLNKERQTHGGRGPAGVPSQSETAR